eukprot:12435835-Alexandrium_andersonii.AAC.1
MLRRCASSSRSIPECAAGAERGGSAPRSAGSPSARSAAVARRVGVQRAASGPPDPRRGGKAQRARTC